MKMSMPSMICEDLVTKAIDVINESHTQMQYDHRIAILNRFKTYVKNSETDEELYSKIWYDLPVWCMCFVLDDRNRPLFLSPWQVEFDRMVETTRYTWTFCSRRSGKSTYFSVKIAHIMCGYDKEDIVCFAPTQSQDFVYRNALEIMTTNEFLEKNFLKKSNSEVMQSSFNGSNVYNSGLAVSTGGESRRGISASIVIVDEIESVPQNIMDSIIRPIIATIHYDTKMWIMGTPSLEKNPSLLDNWNYWIEDSKVDDDYGWFKVTCWRAINEGILEEKYILREKARLPPDAFSMEYEASFPDISNRFYPYDLLLSLRQPFNFPQLPSPGKKYLMTVDWAQTTNNTQVLIGEYDPLKKNIKYVGWRQYNPQKTGSRTSYRKKCEDIKDLARAWGVSWLCPDTTTTQTSITEMLLEDFTLDGVFRPGLPPQIFYGYDRTKSIDAQRLGYKASASLNNDMWVNHRDQMVNRKLMLPQYEEAFVNQFVAEHNRLDKKVTGNGFIKLVEQTNEQKDLAIVAGYMSLFLRDMQNSPAFVGLGAW